MTRRFLTVKTRTATNHNEPIGIISKTKLVYSAILEYGFEQTVGFYKSLGKTTKWPEEHSFSKPGGTETNTATHLNLTAEQSKSCVVCCSKHTDTKKQEVYSFSSILM